MGMLSLKRLMARQRQREWRRRRQKAQKPRDGSIASERKGNNYQCGKRLRYSWPNFPEDIEYHVLDSSTYYAPMSYPTGLDVESQPVWQTTNLSGLEQSPGYPILRVSIVGNFSS
uniref:Expressed protein n=1 Tax=Oryza sativa subsp. japonica TaxID=39947 RepID=Q10L38_ORYSJ|nr:expressed protein [Oryza sativa Japonica Group]